MNLAASVAAAFVAVSHVGFFVLESILWTRPAGLKAFKQTPERAEATRVLALNQGAYNGGIALLIAWAMYAHHQPMVQALLLFIVAMGIVGAATASRSILFLQAIPAAIAFGLSMM